MPAKVCFFKPATAQFRRATCINGCFSLVLSVRDSSSLIMLGALNHCERNLTSATPHSLSSKFLLRMRRQDSAAPLACLAQSPILRSVRLVVSERTSRPGSNLSRRNSRYRHFRRARTSSETATTNNPTNERVKSNYDEHCFPASRCCRRAGLHLWCSNEERHALFASSSWASSLLATQGAEANACLRKNCS